MMFVDMWHYHDYLRPSSVYCTLPEIAGGPMRHLATNHIDISIG